MKKYIKYLHFPFFILAILSYALPALYYHEEGILVENNLMGLTFGSDTQKFSIGLFIIFLILIFVITSSIILIKNNSNLLLNITIPFGLADGALILWAKMLANPFVAEYHLSYGLFISSISLIIGTSILFINHKIIKK